MACLDPLRNTIRQHLGQTGPFDAMFEVKMKTLVGELKCREWNTFEHLADLVVDGSLTIEKIVLELNEKLFDEHASWLFIMCILGLMESLMKRAYEAMAIFGVDESFRYFAHDKFCHEIERYLEAVWAPWIKSEGLGWTYLINNVTEHPHWLERRMLNKIYGIIVRME